MKTTPITQRAKGANAGSPLKFDARFLQGVAGGVAESKKFIAAGDAMGLGMDATERRIQRQEAVAPKKEDKLAKRPPVEDETDSNVGLSDAKLETATT